MTAKLATKMMRAEDGLAILCEYLKRTEKKKDISTLADIVRHWNISEWGNVEKPSANTTVMHLRLGWETAYLADMTRLG